MQKKLDQVWRENVLEFVAELIEGPNAKHCVKQNQGVGLFAVCLQSCQLSRDILLFIMLWNDGMFKGDTVAQLVELVPLSEKDAASDPSCGPFWVEIACSLCACEGFLHVIWF